MLNMPEYDPDTKQVKRVKSRWAALWEDHSGQTLTPRQRGYLNLTGSDIWQTGLDPDRLILDVLLDWLHFVQVCTSKCRHLKYSAVELSSPHLDFFCANWRVFCGK
jgi:hypothetical protein